MSWKNNVGKNPAKLFAVPGYFPKNICPCKSEKKFHMASDPRFTYSPKRGQLMHHWKIQLAFNSPSDNIDAYSSSTVKHTQQKIYFLDVSECTTNTKTKAHTTPVLPQCTLLGRKVRKWSKVFFNTILNCHHRNHLLMAGVKAYLTPFFEYSNHYVNSDR